MTHIGNFICFNFKYTNTEAKSSFAKDGILFEFLKKS